MLIHYSSIGEPPYFLRSIDQFLVIALIVRDLGEYVGVVVFLRAR